MEAAPPAVSFLLIYPTKHFFCIFGKLTSSEKVVFFSSLIFAWLTLMLFKKLTKVLSGIFPSFSRQRTTIIPLSMLAGWFRVFFVCYLPRSMILPDRPFFNFRASRLVGLQILCSSGISCDGFWSSKIVKRSVGYDCIKERLKDCDLKKREKRLPASFNFFFLKRLDCKEM